MKISAVRVLAMSDPVPVENRHRTDLGTKVKSDSAIIVVETDSGLSGIGAASGEREFTRHDFLSLMQHEAIDIAQPDVARAGGFTEIRRIAALTSAAQIRLAPHAWGSGVLFAASIHVAMAAPNCHVLEVSQGHMPMIWDLFEEPYDIRPDGMVYAPTAPGLGFSLREDALDRFKYIDGPEYEW